MNSYLGKIVKANFERGGYQDGMYGLSLHFKYDNYKHSDFKGTWMPSQTEDKPEDWIKQYHKVLVDTMIFIGHILEDAKVDSISELVDKPVEIHVDDEGKLIKWRILTEVL